MTKDEAVQVAGEVADLLAKIQFLEAALKKIVEWEGRCAFPPTCDPGGCSYCIARQALDEP